jgi:PAS domain S-box-containing protein
MTAIRIDPETRGEPATADSIPAAGSRRRRSAVARASPAPGQSPEDWLRTTGLDLAGLKKLMDTAPVAAFAKDTGGRYTYANRQMLATLGRYMGLDWRGKSDADLWPGDAAAAFSVHDRAVIEGGARQVFLRVVPLDDGPHTVILVEFPLMRDKAIAGVGGIGIDLTAWSRAESALARLVAVVDHTADAVLMVDLTGCITFVNAGFERLTGYTRAEVIGHNPRLLKSGLQSSSFYQHLWTTIKAGRQWEGELVNRRKDGSFFTQESVISPIRDADGRLTGYVSVNRDVTDKRALVEDSIRSASEHALVLDIVRDLSPDSSPEARARAICDKVVSLNGIDAAQILVFELDGRALPLGHVIAGRPDPAPRHLSYQVGRRLRIRAGLGPWIEPWANRQGQAYDQLVEQAGPSALAYAPIRSGDKLIGLLSVQSVDVANKSAISDLLPTLVEFADLAGALIGRDIVDRIEMQRGGEHVANIIATHAYDPVFQPIVDMVLDQVVGYEALTRFRDGSDPEAVFAEAAAVHLGVALESGVTAAALAASRTLPSAAWLNVNASPEFILAGGQLRYLIAGFSRPVVVEVTEHEAIVDYTAFRAAIASLGPNVRLAVDDMGTGFNSLRHILELHPAFVKLDRWLVSGLEADEARQAMIVGLKHFAMKTGCRLIAEGIETDREIAVLRALEIDLGQGYALGRPKAADALAVRARRRARRREDG